MILPNRTREENKIRNADDKLQARLLAKQQKLFEILEKIKEVQELSIRQKEVNIKI